MVELRTTSVDILSDYGFELKTFAFNHQRSFKQKNNNFENYVIEDKAMTQTLVVLFNLKEDIFDRLGLIGRLIVQAKIILQKLWSDKLDWDIPIPQNLYKTWT